MTSYGEGVGYDVGEGFFCFTNSHYFTKNLKINPPLVTELEMVLLFRAYIHILSNWNKHPRISVGWKIGEGILYFSIYPIFILKMFNVFQEISSHLCKFYQNEYKFVIYNSVLRVCASRKYNRVSKRKNKIINL